MARRIRKGTAAFALGLCGAALLGSASQAAHKPRPPAGRSPLAGVTLPPLGTDSVPADADRALAVARTLHARVVRIAIPWSVLEPRAPKQLDPGALAFTDRLVSDASAAGIRLIMTVYGTPCWASSAPPALEAVCGPTRPGGASAWPPRDPGDYAALVGFLAQRYGGRLTAIEVWNEPDQANELYFAGPDKVEHYTALLKAAYQAIKAANPRVAVLGGALVGNNGAFLRAMYAQGAKGYYDGLSIHFYTLQLGSIRAIRDVQKANGDAAPLWLNEFGWSSCYPRLKVQEEQPCVTASAQGPNLADIYHALSRTPYVAADVMYQMQDTANESFGLMSANGRRKPAFAVLAKVLAWPFGKQRPVKLHLRRRGRTVVASGSGPTGDYIELDVFRGAARRYTAFVAPDRFNGYSVDLPAVLGTHGLRVRAFQYWAGPRRAAHRSI